ncbi:hypothetical protein JWG41_16185 [Leptospira sp. 201903075]|uniref:hypothetical protein n=1 Tax=Leptospira chreensis TaxID=2810035 RepID=UPI001963AEE0|nr:hypothetical protein [Leptospira chreensis]MBM9591792.1 hypothetical protein [Leptospira chreensis]MBM9591988.1 hypothetical protein [Leptospira chreensis]
MITFYMGVLPGMIDNCPAAEFTVEKGVDYPISLQKGNTSWFQFSPRGNVKPQEESRDYFLTVTKDSSTSILLKAWRSCKNFSSPPSAGMTPYTETPTEVKFKIEYDSLQFPERNRYHLELTSENQTTVTIRQN